MSVPVAPQADVDALRALLDLMENFPDNDQRARYLLTCNWMRDRDAVGRARTETAEAELDELRGKHAEAEWLLRMSEDARDRAERQIEAVEALVDEWTTEGPSLVRNTYSAGDVHEGQTLERCAFDLRAALGIDK